MWKPYFMEKERIAQAQCEDRRDGIEIEKYKEERKIAEQLMDEFKDEDEQVMQMASIVGTKALGSKKARKPTIHKYISAYNQQSRNGCKVFYLDIHYVGALGSAKNNCRYFAGGNRNASAHFFVDKAIWQSIPLSKAAWHVGGGLQDTGARSVGGNRGATLHGINTNNNSIGIELCCKKLKNGQIVPTKQAVKAAVPLVRWLMEEYNIPASRVVRHFDVTGKHCPNGYISRIKWEELHKTLTGYKTPKYPTVTLRKGSVGGQVERLQRCLNKIMNVGLTVDGSFGPATEQAVEAFQKRYKLKIDGSVGPETRGKIKELI